MDQPTELELLTQLQDLCEPGCTLTLESNGVTLSAARGPSTCPTESSTAVSPFEENAGPSLAGAWPFDEPRPITDGPAERWGRRRILAGSPLLVIEADLTRTGVTPRDVHRWLISMGFSFHGPQRPGHPRWVHMIGNWGPVFALKSSDPEDWDTELVLCIINSCTWRGTPRKVLDEIAKMAQDASAMAASSS
jgi:hypothetical protein